MAEEKVRDIVQLTGLPVSDDMQDILDRCSKGKYVDMSEIEATPELKTARSCVSHATPTAQLMGREAIRENVFTRLMNYGSVSLDETGKPLVDKSGNTLYNGNVRRDSRLDIVIGLPASGKSSAIVDTISYTHGSMLIDNDEAKRMFPEFNKGWGASVVHKESQDVEKHVFEEAVTEGRNIVLPKVGSDANKLVNEYISFAKDNGYKVNVHFVDLDRNKALGRMMGRFIHTGRFLEPALIDKYANEREGNRIAKAYEELKASDMVDGYSMWDNDVARGEKPILVESNLSEEYIVNARTKGEMSYGEHEHSNGALQQSSARDSGELRFSGGDRGDRGTDVKGNERTQFETKRDGRNGHNGEISLPSGNFRQVCEVSQKKASHGEYEHSKSPAQTSIFDRIAKKKAISAAKAQKTAPETTRGRSIRDDKTI